MDQTSNVFTHGRVPIAQRILNYQSLSMIVTFKKFGAMHFIYYIHRSIATKVDSTYLGY